MAKGDLDLDALDDEQDKEQVKEDWRKAQDEYKDLVARIKEVLGAR